MYVHVKNRVTGSIKARNGKYTIIDSTSVGVHAYIVVVCILSTHNIAAGLQVYIQALYHLVVTFRRSMHAAINCM